MTINGVQLSDIDAGVKTANVSAKSSTNRGGLFSKLLSGQKSFKSAMKNSLEVKGNTTLNLKISGNSGNIESSLKNLIEKLSQSIKAKYGNTEGLTLDKESLSELTQLLETSGVSKKSITRFLSSLDKSGDKIKVSDLLKSLTSLKDDDDSDPKINLSFLPFIETELNKTGISADKISSIVSDNTDEKGIDLKKLLKAVKNTDEYKDAKGKISSFGTENKSEKYLLNAGKRDINNTKDNILEFAKKITSLINENSKNADGEITNNIISSLTNKIQKNADKETKNSKNINWGNEQFIAEKQLADKGFSFKHTNPNSGVKTFDGKSKTLIETKSIDLNNLSNNKSETGELFKNLGSKPVLESPLEVKANEFSSVMRYKASKMPGAGSSLPKYVENHVSKQLANAVLNGKNEVNFHIKPPDLGKIHMNIQQEGQHSLKVTILAEQHGTKEMIQHHVTEIKHTMSETGIRIDKIEVQLSGSFGDSSAQDKYFASNTGNKGNRKQNNARHDKSTYKIEGIDTEIQKRAGPNNLSGGRLDLVA